jgi:hypothetical protein
MQGLQFGLSQSQTNYWIHRLVPVLKQTLADLGMQQIAKADKFR